MAKIPESCPPVKARTELESALLEAEASLRQTIALWFTELLVAIASHVLGRTYHWRRAKVSGRLRREGRCHRCDTRNSHRHTRNGFRRRQLLTRRGDLGVDLPRVRCACGGSIDIDFDGLLLPYQRIWDDVDDQVRLWGALAVSLRQMRKGFEVRTACG